MPSLRAAAVAVLLALASAASAVAQPLTIGSMPERGLFTLSDDPLVAAPLSFIDISHPASRAGAISAISMRWRKGTGGVCSGSYSMKIVRPNSNASAWTVVANLGTFANDADSVILPAPVNVQQGDLLAVTMYRALATCGGILFAAGADTEVVYRVPAEIVSGVQPTFMSIAHGIVMSAMAYESRPLSATLPVAGSAPGNFGSFFRTTVQLSNVDADTRSDVRIVFHPQGQTAQPSDPFLDVTLLPSRTATYTDILSSMGQTGIGSLDIFATAGKLPMVTARVFNDNGAAGTQGFTEDAVLREQVMKASQYGALPFPADFMNSRMNIGVRTFDKGATVSFTPFSADGTFHSSTTKTYPPNYFEQFNAATIHALEQGWISVYVTAGSAIVYGSYTDNRTNDSSMKYANAP